MKRTTYKHSAKKAAAAALLSASLAGTMVAAGATVALADEAVDADGGSAVDDAADETVDEKKFDNKADYDAAVDDALKVPEGSKDVVASKDSASGDTLISWTDENGAKHERTVVSQDGDKSGSTTVSETVTTTKTETRVVTDGNGNPVTVPVADENGEPVYTETVEDKKEGIDVDDTSLEDEGYIKDGNPYEKTDSDGNPLIDITYEEGPKGLEVGKTPEGDGYVVDGDPYEIGTGEIVIETKETEAGDESPANDGYVKIGEAHQKVDADGNLVFNEPTVESKVSDAGDDSPADEGYTKVGEHQKIENGVPVTKRDVVIITTDPNEEPDGDGWEKVGEPYPKLVDGKPVYGEPTIETKITEAGDESPAADGYEKDGDPYAVADESEIEYTTTEAGKTPAGTGWVKNGDTYEIEIAVDGAIDSEEIAKIKALLSDYGITANKLVISEAQTNFNGGTVSVSQQTGTHGDVTYRGDVSGDGTTYRIESLDGNVIRLKKNVKKLIVPAGTPVVDKESDLPSTGGVVLKENSLDEVTIVAIDDVRDEVKTILAAVLEQALQLAEKEATVDVQEANGKQQIVLPQDSDKSDSYKTYYANLSLMETVVDEYWPERRSYAAMKTSEGESSLNVSIGENQVLVVNVDVSSAKNEDGSWKPIEFMGYTINGAQNVDGSLVSQQIIWNFGDYGGELTLRRSTGTIIAPNASVVVPQTSSGQIACDSFTNTSGEWHYTGNNIFDGKTTKKKFQNWKRASGLQMQKWKKEIKNPIMVQDWMKVSVVPVMEQEWQKVTQNPLMVQDWEKRTEKTIVVQDWKKEVQNSVMVQDWVKVVKTPVMEEKTEEVKKTTVETSSYKLSWETSETPEEPDEPNDDGDDDGDEEEPDDDEDVVDGDGDNPNSEDDAENDSTLPRTGDDLLPLAGGATVLAAGAALALRRLRRKNS